MIQITIHEEQGRLRGVEAYVRRCCTAIASNFRDTEAELYKLLAHYEDSPVYITARADGQRTRVDVYINTNRKKALAEAVVYEVGHYFGNPDTKPENTKDTAIIERKAEAWLQTIPPDTYTTKPDLYPGRVFDRAMLELQAVRTWESDPQGKTPPRYDFPLEGITLDGCKISDSDLAAIVEAVGRWVKSQDQAPTAQQLPDELKTEAAQAYFAKAVELGLMAEDYKWLSGLQVLACFAREMSISLNLGKGGRISWKPFEALFNIAPGKLRLNYNDIQKTGQDPIDAHLVDEVFK